MIRVRALPVNENKQQQQQICGFDQFHCIKSLKNTISFIAAINITRLRALRTHKNQKKYHCIRVSEKS